MVLGVLFEGPDHESLASRLAAFSHPFSSNLLEAEVRSAMNREDILDPGAVELLERINWVFPDRPLSSEFNAVLSAGYLRGADLWHLACALYLRGSHTDLEFLSLDRRQLEVAQRLGLKGLRS
jgi:hypothetical protein